MVNQQVTILALNNVTSETTRDITLKFNNYLNQKVLYKKIINKRFLEWFIGFIESGKGCFKVLNNKVYFDITVNIEDIQVLYCIKKELGFGKILMNRNSVNVMEGARSASFYVTNFYNFYLLVTLFNGNLCTVYKKQEFKIWLNIFNIQYFKEILFIDRDIKPSLSTGWLSGYIDALGDFTGRTSSIAGKELNSKITNLTFHIIAHLKEFYILIVISEILNINVKNIKYNKDKDVWILSIYSFNKLKLIVNYLKRYTLKTSKKKKNFFLRLSLNGVKYMRLL